MRAAIGSALNSSHLETIETRESAIDRIGALAHGTKLGRLLYHWRYAGQDRYAGPVLFELGRKARRRFQIHMFHVEHKTLERCVKQAATEWYSPQCSTCRGARELVIEKLRVICAGCEGSGLKRYPDRERMRALQVDYGSYKAVWEGRLTELIQLLGAADTITTATARFQLKYPLDNSN